MRNVLILAAVMAGGWGWANSGVGCDACGGGYTSHYWAGYAPYVASYSPRYYGYSTYYVSSVPACSSCGSGCGGCASGCSTACCDCSPCGCRVACAAPCQPSCCVSAPSCSGCGGCGFGGCPVTARPTGAVVMRYPAPWDMAAPIMLPPRAPVMQPAYVQTRRTNVYPSTTVARETRARDAGRIESQPVRASARIAPQPESRRVEQRPLEQRPLEQRPVEQRVRSLEHVAAKAPVAQTPARTAEAPVSAERRATPVSFRTVSRVRSESDRATTRDDNSGWTVSRGK